VWHLTGGVELSQGLTAVDVHEAVIWIEQQPEGEETREGVEAPTVRTVLVRMAGGVEVRRSVSSAVDGEQVATIRSDRWSGRFAIIRDPKLDFKSVVASGSRPAVYEAPANITPMPSSEIKLVSGEEVINEVEPAQFAEFGDANGGVIVPSKQTITTGRRLRAFP